MLNPVSTQSPLHSLPSQQAPVFGSNIPILGQAQPKHVYGLVETNEHIPTQDINGDGIADVSHCTLIERLIKAFDPQAEVIKFVDNNQDENGMTSRGTMQGLLEKAIEHLDNMLPLDALNLSFSFDSPFFEPFTPEMIELFSESYLDFFESHDQPEQREHGKLLTALKELAQRIPVFVGAGNSGEEYFNELSLVPDTITVGALTPTNKPTPYTAQHGLVQRYALGDYTVRRVAEGYDINGDDIPEFSMDEVSSGDSILKKYLGQSEDTIPEQNKINASDYTDLAEQFLSGELDPRFIDCLISMDSLSQALQQQELNDDALLDVQSLFDSFKESGDFLVLNDEGKTLILRSDTEEKLRLDPENTGDKKGIFMVSGTSLAAPREMVASQLNKTA